MNGFLKKVFATDNSWALFIVRVVVGLTFAMHGGDKFFGKGIDAVSDGFASMGIPMPYLSALLAASAEFFGGIFFVLGLLVRPAAIPMGFTMIVAFATVHGKNGFFLPTGFEYVFVLFFMFMAILVGGAGAASIDRIIARKIPS